MSKEEYAQLWYLLGKFKYTIAESLVGTSSLALIEEQQKVLKSIDAITKLCIIDGSNKKD